MCKKVGGKGKEKWEKRMDLQAWSNRTGLKRYKD